MTSSDRLRGLLRGILDAAIAAAQPRVCLPPALPDPPHEGRIVIVGAGKAAAAMAVAAENHYREKGMADRISGAVVTRYGARLPTSIIAVDEAGHPVPDEAGSVAAARALQLAGSAAASDIVVCLLSGGASALWAAPAAGIGLARKQDITRALLRSGAPISEINCVRKHLSCIKGGRLAAAAAPAAIITLAISDVPGDDPAAIGSGPTVADPTTLADARAVLSQRGIKVDAAIAGVLANPANETLKPGALKFSRASYRLIATPAMALDAAAAVAADAGYAVEVLGDAIEGEAREVALDHAARAFAAHRQGRRVAILSGGELTVSVKGAGIGGPNQEYALALAIALHGQPGICGLAADTDGIDGGSGARGDPAGAVVLPDTLSRALLLARLDRNPAMFLANNDATTFFAGLDDLVFTGPTQTNVNDLRAILVDP